MRNSVIRWSGLLCVAALAACGTSDDEPSGTGGGGSFPPGGGAGGSLPPLGGTGTGGVTGGAGGTTTVTSGTGGTPVGGASGAGTGGTAGTAGTDPGAGSGGAGGSSSGPNGWFTVPDSCGAATPNATVGNTCPGTAPPAIKLTEIVSGLVGPTYAIQAPGDPSRIYVTEQGGSVRVVKDGALEAAPLLDLRDISGAAINVDEITTGYAENGLLNMVFHPKYETTKKFYVSYTKQGPLFAIAEFTMKDDFTVDVTTYKELGTFPQYAFRDGAFPVGTDQSTNHVGSSMEFGPDGCLYVSRGEGGGENDARSTGQNTSDTESSVLRIDLANWGTPPAGNLAGLVWNFGFRNPWRISFDRVTGDLYIGDVGQDAGSGFEEVNVEPRGLMGQNYGWSPTAGNADCSAAGGCRKPAVTYPITNTENSVIGGYVYRGTKMPEMVGRYVWADWTEREIKTFVYKGENAGNPEICDEYATGVIAPTKIRSFGQALDGELYVIAAGAPVGGLGSASPTEAGTLYRIDAM